MPDYVLSVWKAGDGPVRLCRVGEDIPVAEHAEGFDVSDFLVDGTVVVPEHSLTPEGLLDVDRMAAVGTILWDRLTSRDKIRVALEDLLGTDRIYLDLQTADLHCYPWELLRTSNQYLFTAANGPRWCLGRPERTKPGFAGKPPEPGHPLRVLVLIGIPQQEGDRIRAEQELLTIEQAAHRHNTAVLLKPLYRPGAAQVLTTLQDFRPHIVHFIGHGSAAGEPPQIIVHPTTGLTDPWGADRVRNIFSQAPPGLVVLNACQTGQASTEATSLLQAFTDAGCTAVVGMLGDILGEASEWFSQRFYSEIFDGQPVDTAATLARMAMGHLAESRAVAGAELEIRSNWALPRLIVRGKADEAVTMSKARPPLGKSRLIEDFVARWDERWQALKAMDGSYRSDPETEVRLAVLAGNRAAGQTELLNALGGVRRRAGEAVLHVNLSGPHTGGWRDVLQRIAEQAASDNFKATALQATAEADGTSSVVISQFRTDLEALVHLDGDGTEPLLVVLDGLRDWAKEVVQETVLPELCWPFVRAAPGSRVRMMVALPKDIAAEIGVGLRPGDWKEVVVGEFNDPEWSRAVTHFKGFWLAKLPAPTQDVFTEIAEQMLRLPQTNAQTLASLRLLAMGQMSP